MIHERFPENLPGRVLEPIRPSHISGLDWLVA